LWTTSAPLGEAGETLGDEHVDEEDECSSTRLFVLVYTEAVYALRPIICFFIVKKAIRFSARGD
jgi:hypothetical protein